ncbi:MAG: sugar porter family MFS transporter [Thermoplasmata archaeon]|nr:sugar porter family MFS transporter [Thermoplasmata archaeon]
MSLSVDTSVTVASALAGALIGSVGATFLSDWLARRNEKEREYEQVVRSYLAQLQNAADLLWGRLRNMVQPSQGTQPSLNPEDETYFVPTMLYALGKLLAQRYIMNLKGAYAEIERLKPGLGLYLFDQLETIDRTLGEVSATISGSMTGTVSAAGVAYLPFYTYDRQALAETVILLTDAHPETITYVAFRSSYDSPTSSVRVTLEPARQFVTNLGNFLLTSGLPVREPTDQVMSLLVDVAQRLEAETGIKTGIRPTNPAPPLFAPAPPT